MLFAAIGFYLYGTVAKELAARNEDHLNSMTQLVRHVLDDVTSLEQLLADPGLVTHLLVGHADLRLTLYGPDRKPLLLSAGTPFPNEAWSHIDQPMAQGVTSGLWRDTAQSAYRLAAARIHTGAPGLQDSTILLALDVSQEMRVLRTFRNTLFGVMPLASLIAAAMGFLIASRGLRPIVRIAQSARRITASQLQERLDTRGIPEELAALVESFNVMLARLEDSFRRLSDFSADLAHELRTPLTNLLGRTQVTLAQKRSADEYREVLESNIEEVEQLARLVSDMLFIAQVDRAEAALDREDVQLRPELERVAEFFSVSCEERGITIAVSGEATVRADRTMLRRAAGNLISNAIRHSPDRERIDVVVGHDETKVTVSVIDRGAGVTPEHRSRIFDRFYRSDPSRTRNSGGSGLGLAIVRSIAKLHGGDVSIESEPGKPTVFTIALPA